MWMEDADSLVARGCPECARAIYAVALTTFPTKKSVWVRAAQHEKAHGTRESLDALLRRAVSYCPQAQVLWLMGAKEKWQSGDVEGARAILNEAFRANPDSEQVWLAAQKLESENSQPERARKLLARARERAGTERVWMKSVTLERDLGELESALALLGPALKAHPRFWKLHLLKAQLESRAGQHAAARETLARAVKVRRPGRTRSAPLPHSALAPQRLAPAAHREALAARAAPRDTRSFGRVPRRRAWPRDGCEPGVEMPRFPPRRSEVGVALPSAAGVPRLRACLAGGGAARGGARRRLEGALAARGSATQADGRAAGWLEQGPGGEPVSPSRTLRVGAPQLWLEAVRLERRAGNRKAAMTLMAKALQQCKSAGLLWAEAIAMEQRAQQKTKSSDALKASIAPPSPPLRGQ